MPFDVGIADRLRRAGLDVRETKGWKTRGDSSFFPRASVNHHTAGAPRSAGVHPSLGVLINGRADLSGPLCNVSMDYAGVFYAIAAGRANHAGIPDGGSWRGATGNTTAWGLEIEHPGTFPLEADRLELAARCHAALIDGTVGAEKVGQHWEWAPSRKIDLFRPGVLDPDAFRARVAHHLATLEDDMPLTDEDLDKIADRVWKEIIPGGGGSDPERAQIHLRAQTNHLRALRSEVAAVSVEGVDEQAIATAVIAAVGPEVAKAVANELASRLGA